MEDKENQKINLRNIKYKYILSKILDNLDEIKFLNIIKYNKAIQDICKKNINDYKNKYYEIEIELIPRSERFGKGKIINIDEKYCHIYFDDKPEEVKRNFIKKNEKVSKIKVILNYEGDSLRELFQLCFYMQKIKFIKFRNKNIKEMSNMFYQCKGLEEIDISKLKTDNVINMSNMFYECSSLQELDLTNFNTINTIDMSSMFKSMKLLKKLNISNFNTSNVKYMNEMFQLCKSLKN